LSDLTLCIHHRCGHAADPMLVAVMMFIDPGFWRFCERACAAGMAEWKSCH
jgi:hypothetical protein